MFMITLMNFQIRLQILHFSLMMMMMDDILSLDLWSPYFSNFDRKGQSYLCFLIANW